MNRVYKLGEAKISKHEVYIQWALRGSSDQ